MKTETMYKKLLNIVKQPYFKDVGFAKCKIDGSPNPANAWINKIRDMRDEKDSEKLTILEMLAIAHLAGSDIDQLEKMYGDCE